MATITLSSSAFGRLLKNIVTHKFFRFCTCFFGPIILGYALFSVFSIWNHSLYLFIVGSSLVLAVLLLWAASEEDLPGVSLVALFLFLFDIGIVLKALTYDFVQISENVSVVQNNGTLIRYEDVGSKTYILPENTFTVIHANTIEKSYPVTHVDNDGIPQILDVDFSVTIMSMDWLIENQDVNVSKLVDQLLMTYIMENYKDIGKMHLNEYLCEQLGIQSSVETGASCPLEITEYNIQRRSY